MADTMKFDLVSPARRLASGEAMSVQIPGAEGDFTALVDHAPTIATLRPGIVTVKRAGGEEKFVVTGGFAEITPEGASVLTERGMAAEDVTQEVIDEFVTAAVSARDNTTPEMLDELAKQVGDIAAVAAELGLHAKAS